MILLLWEDADERGLQGSKTEITQTLRSFILRGVGVPNGVPDAAVRACPSEITDAGGFITTHLERKKKRDTTLWTVHGKCDLRNRVHEGIFQSHLEGF